MASNLVNNAKLLVKTTGQVLNMSKVKSSPNAANLMSPDTFKDPSSSGVIEAETPTNIDNDPDKMSEDEEKRIMRMIEDEDSSDEEDDNSENNDQGSDQEAA